MSYWAGTVLHVALLVAATAAHHISSTPPRIAQQSSDHLLRDEGVSKESSGVQSGLKRDALHGKKWFNRLGMMGVALSRLSIWPIVTFEVLARLLSLYPSSALSRAVLPIVLPTAAPGVSVLTVPGPVWAQKLLLDNLPQQFVLSVLAIFVGFAIRRWCFDVMGRHFSFTHTTLDGHELIKGGPYGIVRHPSYTGEVLVRWGMLSALLSPGGFVRACGAMPFSTVSLGTLSTPQRLVFASVRSGLAFFIAWITFNCPYLFWRAPREDATLRETFGKKWDEYAKEVPYRFIPYVA